MSYVEQPRFGRRPKDGPSTRPCSFNSKRPDGLLLINGRLFKNQYQYRKYWMLRNYRDRNDRALIEGVDFFLHRDGHVVQGSDIHNERQI